jgi:hypothetical protein
MADQYIGRRISVGLATEATRGTYTAPTIWCPHTSLDFDDKAEKVESEQAVGRIEDIVEAHTVSKWGEGKIEGDVRYNAFGPILYATLGSCSSALLGSSVYQHTFSLANTNTHKSLSITAVDPIGASRFAGAVVNNLEIKADVGEIVTYSADFMSKVSKGVSATASFATDYTFTSNMVCVKVDDTVAGLTAASNIANVKGISIKMSKNVEKQDVLCSYEPENFFNKQFQVEGEITLDYTDRTWRDYFLNNNYKAMRIMMTNPGAVLGGAYTGSLQIDLSRVYFNEWAPDKGLDDIVSQKVSFKATYDLANSYASVYTVILNNMVASYP